MEHCRKMKFSIPFSDTNKQHLFVLSRLSGGFEVSSTTFIFGVGGYIAGLECNKKFIMWSPLRHIKAILKHCQT